MLLHRSVAVGTTVTRRPPHRTGRAGLPHPAPTLGNDAKPHERIGMTDADGRNPWGDVATHPMPREMSLTAAGEHTPPQATHGPGKREERRIVHRHAVIANVTYHDRTHIRAEFRERLVHATPKFRFDGLQLRLEPRPHRPPQHREPTPARRRTAVREAKEVETLGLTLATCSPIRGRIAVKFEESRFVRVQGQAEPRESVAQFRETLLGVVSMLEAHDEIIGEPHDDHVAVRLPLAPSMDPKVEDVVQVEIGQERTDHSPNAKGNFQFERVIVGWRDAQAVLDLRRK